MQTSSAFVTGRAAARVSLSALGAALVALGVAACGGQGGAPEESAAQVSESASPSPSVQADTMSAAGIGVSDLERSSEFYQEALGMRELTTYQIPGFMDEIVLGFDDGSRGASVVLMHYTDGREVDYEGNPVKLVFYVDDAAAAAERIEEAGGTVVLEPAPQPTLGNVVVGLARDLDGYTLELLEADG
ncbi:VOC family protein [Nocardiopsis sp. LOL_012]|uniref:VOC family protein n=1 Tax=Nocardiopsis sp. LOL_012 TaxID=3345409 RepID=UPI003A8A47F2